MSFPLAPDIANSNALALPAIDVFVTGLAQDLARWMPAAWLIVRWWLQNSLFLTIKPPAGLAGIELTALCRQLVRHGGLRVLPVAGVLVTG